MKKYFLSVGLIVAAAFTLTNCTQEIDAPVEPSVDGVPFEIVAKSADTKTAYDGDLKTVWVEGDALNLFHEYAGSKEYVKDGEFTYEGGDVFKGTLAEELEEANYNWYAIYPYSSFVKTPASTSGGYLTVASAAGVSQLQKGNNSMDHIAGENYPLAGACIDVEYYEGDPVEIQMNHLTCLLEVVVTNNTAEDLTVSTVAFSAPENIVGTYYLNIVGDETVFTSSGDSFVSKTASLKVEGAEALANGKSAKYYLAVKPFTAAADSEIALSVNGYSKKVTLPAETAFNAGEIKTLNFNYNKVEEVIPEGTDVVVITASELGLENSTDVTILNDGLLSFAKGTNESSAPKYYTSGSAIRMYVGNTLTIAAPEGCVLTKVAFEFVSPEYASPLECTNNINYADGVWEGAFDQLIFTVVGASLQARITKITVHYMSGEVPAAEVVAIQVVDPKVEYYKDTEFEAPEVITIDTNGAIEEADGVQFTGYDLSTVGEQTVTVSYGELTTSYVINVATPAGDEYALFSGNIVEGDYIIVYDGVAMNTTVTSSRLQYDEVEINNDAIFSPSANIVWHIAKSGNYWTIYNAEANKYAASTGAKNKAQMLASGTDDMSLWTITGTSTYEFENKKNASAGVNKTLRRNTTYGFACYATATGGPLTLYKKK